MVETDEEAKLTEPQRSAYAILIASSGPGRAWVNARTVGNVYEAGAGAKWAGPKLKALVNAGLAERNDRREYRPTEPLPEWARVPEPPKQKLKDIVGGEDALRGMSPAAQREMVNINTALEKVAPKDLLTVLFVALVKKLGPVTLSHRDITSIADMFLQERVFQWIEKETGQLALRSFPWDEQSKTVYIQTKDDMPAEIQAAMKASGISFVVMRPS